MPETVSPVIESKRLRIDRLTTTDADDLYRYRSLPDVARFQSWAPESVEDTQEFISGITNVPFDQPGTWFQLALREKTSATLIGDVGLHFIDDDGYQVEVGISISPTRQNQGIASEALEAVLDFLFTDLKKHRVIASIDPRNQASNRMLLKAGFRKEGHFKQSLLINGEWVDDVLSGVLASEWESRRESLI